MLLDWAAWEWAISTNHPTIGLIAAVFMAPIAVGFVWAAARVAVALAQRGVQRLTAPQPKPPREQGRPRPAAAPPSLEPPRPAAPFDIQAEDERVAA